MSDYIDELTLYTSQLYQVVEVPIAGRLLWVVPERVRVTKRTPTVFAISDAWNENEYLYRTDVVIALGNFVRTTYDGEFIWALTVFGPRWVKLRELTSVT